MRARRLLKALFFASLFVLFHKATALGAAPEAEAIPVVAFVGIDPEDLALAGEAGVASVALEEALREHYPVMGLEDIPATRAATAALYWNNCPERLDCLRILGERARASLAVMGRLKVHEGERASASRADTAHTQIFTLQVLDLVKDEMLEPLVIENVGDDPAFLIESTLAVLDRRIELWKASPPMPKVETEEPQHSRVSGSDANVQRSELGSGKLGKYWDKSLGHKGQLLLRASVGGAYGDLGQEYYDVRLTNSDGDVLEEYSRLNLLSGSGGNAQLSLGYGLTRRLTLEARAALQTGSARLVTDTRPLATYQDPTTGAYTFAGCAETQSIACPEAINSVATTLALGVRARYSLSLRHSLQPFLVAGVGLNLHRDAIEPVQQQNFVERSWWNLYPPIQTLGVTLGPGIEYTLGPRVSLFFQVPFTWQLNTNYNDTYTRYSPAADGPYLVDLPAEPANRMPLHTEFDLGIQVRLF